MKEEEPTVASKVIYVAVVGGFIIFGCLAVIGVVVLVWRSRSDINKLTPNIGGSDQPEETPQTERGLNDDAKKEIQNASHIEIQFIDSFNEK